MLWGNITSFGVVEDHLNPQEKVILCHPRWSDIAIQHARQRLFCFYILFNGFMTFYEELVTVFISVFYIKSIYRKTLNCNTSVISTTPYQYVMLAMWCHNDVWHHNMVYGDVIMPYPIVLWCCYVTIVENMMLLGNLNQNRSRQKVVLLRWSKTYFIKI